MKIFYSPSTGGFFHEAVHGERWIVSDLLAGDGETSMISHTLNPDSTIPADAVEVSAEAHAALLARQAEGMVIAPGADGTPVAIDRVASVQEQLDTMRKRRDRELAATDWTQLPDALDNAKRKLWKDHRQALRDLPRAVAIVMSKGGAPSDVTWPTAPG